MGPFLPVQGRLGLTPHWGWSCGSLVTACVHRVRNRYLKNDVCASVGDGSYCGNHSSLKNSVGRNWDFSLLFCQGKNFLIKLSLHLICLGFCPLLLCTFFIVVC